MSSTKSLLVAFVSANALGAVGGCSVYDPALLEQDASSIDAPVPVASRQPPARPTNAEGAAIEPLVFGLRNSLLNQGSAWANIGFDLDGYDTSAATGFASECTPPDGTPQRDGMEGIDNAFGDDLFPLVGTFIPNLQETARAGQEEGFGSPVIRITGWNGTPNDPRVMASLSTGVGATSADGMDGPPAIQPPRDGTLFLADGTEAPPPVWDGEDWIWLNEGAFVANDIDRPLLGDDNAYVADGRLVFRLGSAELIFASTSVGVQVRLREAIVVGELTRTGMENVIITGRWSVADLLSTAQNVGLCPGTSTYNVLASQLDSIADVRNSRPAAGETGLECNALSAAVSFRGSPLRVGGFAPARAIVNQCLSMSDAGVGDAGASDAGVDAGVRDAGVDAFVPVDARPAADAAATPDAFVSPDAP